MNRIVGILAVTLLLAGCVDRDTVASWFERDDYRDKTWAEREREEYLKRQSKDPSAYLRDIASVFNDYNLVLPNGNRIRVCSAYGCTHKQIYRLQPDTLKKAHNRLSSAWTARGERDALEKALSDIEIEMGPAVGTDKDTQGGSFWGNGNPSQMNATDEALNVTSILMVFYRYDMMRYHDLLAPAWKGGALYPVIRDRKTGHKFGIDAGYRDHGGEIKIFPWEGAAP